LPGRYLREPVASMLFLWSAPVNPPVICVIV
jgi:hypothetical protein